MYKFYISLIFVLGIIGSCLATIPEPDKTENDRVSINSIVGVYDGVFPMPVYLFIKHDSTYIKTESGGMMLEGNWNIKGDTITFVAKYNIHRKGIKYHINKDSTMRTIISSSIIDGNRLVSVERKDYNYEKIMDKDRLDLILKSQQRYYSFPLDTLIGNLW